MGQDYTRDRVEKALRTAGIDPHQKEGQIRTGIVLGLMNDPVSGGGSRQEMIATVSRVARVSPERADAIVKDLKNGTGGAPNLAEHFKQAVTSVLGAIKPVAHEAPLTGHCEDFRNQSGKGDPVVVNAAAMRFCGLSPN